MVCIRCKIVVKDELQKLGLIYVVVELGYAEVLEPISPIQHELLKVGLKRFGLEVIDDKKSILIEKIKNIIVEMVHYAEEEPKLNFSDYLCEIIPYDYTYMANLFSEVMGTTIEHFIIAHKIERVKELLIYDELSLTEIASKLHYSNVAHLANQFKKVTGQTTSHFKQLKHKRMIALEDL
jgi:YesN/AraC family two-component response regulator